MTTTAKCCSSPHSGLFRTQQTDRHTKLFFLKLFPQIKLYKSYIYKQIVWKKIIFAKEVMFTISRRYLFWDLHLKFTWQPIISFHRSKHKRFILHWTKKKKLNYGCYHSQSKFTGDKFCSTLCYQKVIRLNTNEWACIILVIFSAHVWGFLNLSSRQRERKFHFFLHF